MLIMKALVSTWNRAMPATRLTALLLVVHTSVQAAAPFQPAHYTRAALSDRVSTLPGLPVSISSLQSLFFGYLTIPTGPSLFYGFAESKSQPATDPLVLWLNGGPGCSSLNGLFNELGPFWPTAEGGLMENPWAWNAEANVLFLESPAWVGFSTSTEPEDSDAPGDGRTAHNNRLALLAFMERFPQSKGRPFYITGESWAGHYVPQLAQAVVEGNKAEPHTAFNLKGILVGNPSLGLVNHERAYLTYMHAWGALSRETYATLTNDCWSVHLDPFNANFTTTCIATSSIADEEIGLWDGMDPYNILAPLCYRGQASILQKQHRSAVSSMLRKGCNAVSRQTAAHSLTENYEGHSGSSKAGSRRSSGSSSGSSGDNSGRSSSSSSGGSTSSSSHIRSLLTYNGAVASHHIATRASATAGARSARAYKVAGQMHDAYPEDPCVRSGSYLADYLNRADVQKALHVNSSMHRLPIQWVECNDTLNHLWDPISRAESQQPVYAKLIAEGIPITLYSGDVDSVCAFSGVLEMAEQLQLPLADPTVRRRAWYLLEGEPAEWDTGGWVAEFKGLVHATVRGAGHMVPYDQPEKALYILTRTLQGQPL